MTMAAGFDGAAALGTRPTRPEDAKALGTPAVGRGLCSGSACYTHTGPPFAESGGPVAFARKGRVTQKTPQNGLDRFGVLMDEKRPRPVLTGAGRWFRVMRHRSPSRNAATVRATTSLVKGEVVALFGLEVLR